MSSDFAYRGTELDIFAQAVNWKRYFGAQLRPYLTGDVLEVGAGLGATTRILCDGRQRSWTCLEADAGLAQRLRQTVASGGFSVLPEVVVNSLEALAAEPAFDAILYIDVLEHIEDDRGHLQQAARRLRPGGALAVLSPAHQWLYTPFDAAIGHHRRYDKAALRAMRLPGLSVEKLIYLDAAGMLLSLGNRLLLRSGSPSLNQILLWDRVFIPCSRLLDPLLGRRLGKSILAVWRQQAGAG